MLRLAKSNGFALVEAIVTLAIASMTVLLLSSIMNSTLLQEERYACRLNQEAKALMQLHEQHPLAKTDLKNQELKKENPKTEEKKRAKIIKESVEYHKKETVQAQPSITWVCPQGEETIRIETIQTQTTRFSSH